jgi:hypothetical protein
MSLNKRTYKTRLCIDQLMKMWPEALRDLTCASPRDRGLEFTSSVLALTSQNVSTERKET